MERTASRRETPSPVVVVSFVFVTVMVAAVACRGCVRARNATNNAPRSTSQLRRATSSAGTALVLPRLGRRVIGSYAMKPNGIIAEKSAKCKGQSVIPLNDTSQTRSLGHDSGVGGGRLPACGLYRLEACHHPSMAPNPRPIGFGTPAKLAV